MIVAGCTRSELPRGPSAYSVIPAANLDQPAPLYRIGPSDTISVSVFLEPDLSLADVRVDTAGNFLYPLIGSVKAGGKTPDELSGEIAARLADRYLENPQVSVIVKTSVSQKVVVEGSVNAAGVYEISGSTTLLGALAMAKGTTRVSALGEVVVFRTINGQRMGAVFNVADIRRGRAPDPQILGDDTVIVGFSALKGAWRDILTTAPLIAVFRPLG